MAAEDAAIYLHLRLFVCLPCRQPVSCVSVLSGTVGLGGSCLPWTPGIGCVKTVGFHGENAWYWGYPQSTLWRWYSRKPVCLWGQESLALCKRDCKLIREAELYVQIAHNAVGTGPCLALLIAAVIIIQKAEPLFCMQPYKKNDKLLFSSFSYCKVMLSEWNLFNRKINPQMITLEYEGGKNTIKH